MGRDVCELLVGAKGKLDIKNVRDQLAWDKAMPNGEMAGNMELVYYLKEANFKMMDPKARKPMLEAIYQPFTDAEVKELKDAGDETADGKVARLAPMKDWSSLQDPEQLQALWDAIFEKTGVKDHKFSKAGGLDTVDEVEVTFDIMASGSWSMALRRLLSRRRVRAARAARVTRLRQPRARRISSTRSTDSCSRSARAVFFSGVN